MGKRVRPFGVLLIGMLMVISGCQTAPDSEWQWYKGALHVHSLWSDGDEFPEVVAQWHRDHGYNFLAMTEHDRIAQSERWIDLDEEFGEAVADGMTTDPARLPRPLQKRANPVTGAQQMRLSTLDEIRPHIEKPERFILINAEEITDACGKKPVHVNAINLGTAIKPQHGSTVVGTIDNNLRAVQEQSESLQRPMLAVVNHPNWKYGITAKELAESDARFFEVYSGDPSVNHLGDDRHPPVERIWDLANTIRLACLKRPPLWGIAGDDAHEYGDLGMHRMCPGRGWVKVRSKELTPSALISAMNRGQFYASSGVAIRKIRTSSIMLKLEIEADGGAIFTTQFIGTLYDPDLVAEHGYAGAINPGRIGTVLATVYGGQPSYNLTGKELYVRAVVTSSKPKDLPTYRGQLEQAWTQPVHCIDLKSRG